MARYKHLTCAEESLQKHVLSLENTGDGRRIIA